MSGKKPSKKTLEEIQEELEAERYAKMLKDSGARRFSGSPSALSHSLASRQFHEPTTESTARRALMQQPAQHRVEFPQVHGMMSATLLREQRAIDAITEQADFLHLLQTKYGAIKISPGTYQKDTYDQAIEHYLNDMEQQRRERFDSIARISQQQQEQFRPAQMVDAARFQQNFQRQHGHQAKQEEKKPEWWKGMFEKAGEYASFARSHPYSQPPPEQPRARGGPARDEPQPGKRRKMAKSKALVVMGFNADAKPEYNELKKAFNKQALLLHPDKNLTNPGEAAVKFKRMRKAFNSLIDKGTSDTDTDTEGGGIIKRRHKTRKTSKKARINTRRKTRAKTHRKSNKRR